MKAQTILVVEDERVPMIALQTKLQAAGYQVLAATNATEALQAARTQKPDLLILDLTLPSCGSFNGQGDGFILLHYLRQIIGGNVPVIIHTSQNPRDVERRAREDGVTSIFKKGHGLKEFLQTVAEILNQRKAEQAA